MNWEINTKWYDWDEVKGLYTENDNDYYYNDKNNNNNNNSNNKNNVYD